MCWGRFAQREEESFELERIAWEPDRDAEPSEAEPEQVEEQEERELVTAG